MNLLKSLFKTNRHYFVSLIIIFISALLFLLIYGKSATFISLNSFHPYWMNIFFIYYTFVGDGIFSICLIALLLFYFKKRKQSLIMFVSFLLSGLIVQLIKNFVFAPRPILFFEKGQYLYFIKGVSLANNHSFPSGHTTTAFAMATLLAIMSENKNYQWLYLAAAVLVAYSRMYLAEHFLVDVLVGAVIGVISSLIAYYFLVDRIKFK